MYKQQEVEGGKRRKTQRDKKWVGRGKIEEYRETTRQKKDG